MERYELTDAQWAAVEPLLPRPTRRGGHPWRDHRQVFNGILWVLVTGARWRTLPKEYGPWSACHDRFRRWRDAGLFDRLLSALHLAPDERGRIDRSLWLADGTSVRASRSAAGGRAGGGPQSDRCPGRSRGGYGTKVRVLACANGVPLAAHLTPGQSHECREVPALLDLARAARLGPAPQARRRQGLQHADGPAPARGARRRPGDPASQGAAGPQRAVRPRGLSAARRGRAADRPAEGEPPRGNAARQARRELPGLRHAGHDPRVLATVAVVGQALDKRGGWWI